MFLAIAFRPVSITTFSGQPPRKLPAEEDAEAHALQLVLAGPLHRVLVGGLEQLEPVRVIREVGAVYLKAGPTAWITLEQGRSPAIRPRP